VTKKHVTAFYTGNDTHGTARQRNRLARCSASNLVDGTQSREWGWGIFRRSLVYK